MPKTIQSEKELLKILPIYNMQPFTYPLSIYEKTAGELLSPCRLDILLRYQLVNDWDNNIKNDYGYYVYKQFLEKYKADNSGGESGTKITFDKWVDEFYDTYTSIRKNGFDSEKNVITIDKNTIATGGAHRIAIGLKDNIKLPTIKADNETTESNYYDYKALKSRNIDLDICYNVICDYVGLKSKNLYCAILYPTAQKHFNEFSELLQNYNANIVCTEKFNLNPMGIEKLSLISYIHDDWLDIAGPATMGVIRNMRSSRYIKNTPTHVILFHMDSHDDVIAIKEKIRNKIGQGKEPLHITDTAKEAIILTRQLFNKNSLNFLNTGGIPAQNFWNLLCKYIDLHNLDTDYILSGSACLGAYGIRDVSDLDYFTVKSNLQQGEITEMESNQYKYYQKDIKEMLNNPKYYFYLNGVKILAPHYTYAFKKQRGEMKDIDDCQMLLPYTKDQQKDIFIIHWWRIVRAFLIYDLVYKIAKKLQKFPTLYKFLRYCFKKIFTI